DPRVEQLEDHAPTALGRLERELEPLARRGLRLDELHLRELLHARLRLARLRGLVAEALDEALHARDLRALGVDRASERELARCASSSPKPSPRAIESARSRQT